MKKIINGKKYDTETAKEICHYQNTWDTGNFNYDAYTLYLKRTGEFFFLHETYNRREILTVDQFTRVAFTNDKDEYVSFPEDFVSEYGSVEQYEELFGEVSE